MYIVKSVGVLSFAKIMGLIYGRLSWSLRRFFSVRIARLDRRTNQDAVSRYFGNCVRHLHADVHGLMGAIMGAPRALLYNLCAGGFELELAQQPAGSLVSYAIIPPATLSI
jgi:hypothetical protein